MNAFKPAVCPHDCPSVCALDVEVLDGERIGRVRGAHRAGFTAGVVCAKVARYAERMYHPGRLTRPLVRTGEKGSGEFTPISWDDALDRVTDAFLDAEQTYGAESVWPYYYAGTMGLVMRDGINRLRHAKGYSGQYSTICTKLAQTGYVAGTGKLLGPDPREMARADVIVIWGANPVHTNINVMTHVARARKNRGAALVAIDVYDNPTMQQADMALCLRPGTDGALACAVMHVLFRDGYADRAYLDRFTDDAAGLEAHLRDKSPQWAAAITGLETRQIEEFAALVGRTQRCFFRLGYGFSRSRNGAVNMHAALSVAVVSGCWQYEGGGAFYSNAQIYGMDMSLIGGKDVKNPAIRQLDHSRIGPVLTSDPYDLAGGPPVAAMLIQNTNPMVVAPEQAKVRAGFMREDLFVCVHEQFMTETAQMADIVLPATMFLEHDDLYLASGHQCLQFSGRLVDPPGECRSNHEVITALAGRLGSEHPGFAMTARQLIERTLEISGHGSLAALEEMGGFKDCQPDFNASHYLDGFAHDDGRFHFRPDWTTVRMANAGVMGPVETLPEWPDHWAVTEEADEAHPFRLATSPARGYLNTSFNNLPTSRRQTGRPLALVHPDDAAALDLRDDDPVWLGNERGQVGLHLGVFEGIQPGVIVVEGLSPNADFSHGEGINTLTGADQPAPYGGAPFHDVHVWLRKRLEKA
jgi:anaerobic selenocysteine-containing dehydrogenase